MYSYVENNPVNNIDPSGNYCVSKDGRNAHSGDCNDGNNVEHYYIPDYMITGGFPEITDSVVIGVYNNNQQLVKNSSSKKEYSTFWKKTGLTEKQYYDDWVAELHLSDAALQSMWNTTVPMNVGKILTKTTTKTTTTKGNVNKGCNCFTAGTQIQTDEGEKNIEDIEVGDRVLAKDENNPDGELVYKEVTALYRNQRDDIIKLHVGEQVIETTDNHPFWVEGKGWVFADELRVGDKLQKADGSNLTIDKVEFVKLDEPVMVYNFTVADFHTYYVTDLGIWVHNTNCSFGAGKYMTSKEMNQALSVVKSGKDVTFRTKQQAVDFIKSKFPGFKQEVAGGRSAEGWHFDSHPVNGSSSSIDHINIYSKEQGFRIHIFWSE